MLVLRRRARESIVFERGLDVTLVDVVDHRAWLSFSAPSVPVAVVLSPYSVASNSVCIALRAPRTIDHVDGIVTVTVDDAQRSGDGVAALLVNRSVGEQICLPGISFGVTSLEQGRAVLSVRVAELPEAVGVSVFSISGAEVKIGIAAPDDVRVYREEVWLAMRRANEAAASWTPGDLASLAAVPRSDSLSPSPDQPPPAPPAPDPPAPA